MVSNYSETGMSKYLRTYSELSNFLKGVKFNPHTRNKLYNSQGILEVEKIHSEINHRDRRINLAKLCVEANLSEEEIGAVVEYDIRKMANLVKEDIKDESDKRLINFALKQVYFLWKNTFSFDRHSGLFDSILLT